MTILDLLEVLGHHLGTILQSSGSRMHTDGPWKVPGWIFMIFDRFWVPLWIPFWSTLWYVLSLEASKNRFGLQACFLMIFELKIWWFLMSQPMKSIVNSSVFNRFHFLDFFMKFMISGTCLDLILDTFWGLGWLIRWFLGYLRLLEFLMKFRVSPETAKAEWIGVLEGKLIFQGALLPVTEPQVGRPETWQIH